MTRGGPGISTETLDMYAYSQGFIEAGKISYASSMAVIMMVLTIVTFTFTEEAEPMKISTFLLRLLLVLAAALVVLPLLWTLLNAFKTNADLLVSTPKLIFQPVFDNMSYVLNRRSVARALTNSLIICSSAVVLGAVLGVPAAYVIARFKNRITAEAQFFVLSLRFLPPVAIAIPMLVIWLGLDLYDTRLSLIVTYLIVTASITIWLSVPAFERVSLHVEEAARVDGLGPYATFFRIALPIARFSLRRHCLLLRPCLERVPACHDAHDLEGKDPADHRV